jgi:hypothetical protein
MKISESKFKLYQLDSKYCHICHETKLFTEFYSRCSECKNCTKQVSRTYRDGERGFFQILLNAARGRSKKRAGKGRIEAGIFDLSIDDVNKLWTSQNGLCYYSKIPMSAYTCSDWRASLERLDDNIGYINGNVVLCCLELNHRVKWTHEKIASLFEPHHMDLTKINFNLEKKIKIVAPWVKIVENDEEFYECHYCAQIKELHEYGKDFRKGCKECAKRLIRERRLTPRYNLLELLTDAKKTTKTREKKSVNKFRDYTFDLDFEFLVDLFYKQGGMCAYSQMPLNFGPCKTNDWTTSIERIDPLRGYVKDNVCLIAYEFNTPDYTCINKFDDTNGSSAWTSEKFEFFRRMYIENNKVTENVPTGKHKLKKKPIITLKQK